jgi:quercetin dioxygenase-like cupin family protein
VKKVVKVFSYETIQAKTVEETGASKVRIRWLITEDSGAPTFAMRLFEIEPSGYSPLHTHPWEHEVFILEGEGIVFDGKKSISFKRDDVVFTLPNEWHQFKNIGKDTLKFLCLIPNPKKSPA